MREAVVNLSHALGADMLNGAVNTSEPWFIAWFIYTAVATRLTHLDEWGYVIALNQLVQALSALRLLKWAGHSTSARYVSFSRSCSSSPRRCCFFPWVTSAMRGATTRSLRFVRSVDVNTKAISCLREATQRSTQPSITCIYSRVCLSVCLSVSDPIQNGQKGREAERTLVPFSHHD